MRVTIIVPLQLIRAALPRRDCACLLNTLACWMVGRAPLRHRLARLFAGAALSSQ